MGKSCPKCNTRANLSLNAVKLIRKVFNCKELLSLTTNNFYSILNYNSEVWLSPCIYKNVKYKIFVALANALNFAYQTNITSFVDLHKT